MFGYFRFFLATLVLISHVGINVQGSFNLGVSAVVSFYMLAGFVVCNLFSKKFISKKPQYILFYYERALRVFPQYIFILILTLFFIIVTNYGSPIYDIKSLLNNIIIIPLNYYMFIDNSILQEPKWWLIPPAWSLGVELQAYFILPFIVFYRKIKIIIAIVSFFIFITASLGIINTDIYGYRLIPGMLFIFILGVTIYRNTSENVVEDIFDRYFPAIVYATLVLILIILGVSNMLLAPYVRETIFGILIGFPIITYISKSTYNMPMNHFIGDLSYGVFLSHFLAMWIVEYYFPLLKSMPLSIYVMVIFIISLLLSMIGVLVVENSVKKYRFNLSKFK